MHTNIYSQKFISKKLLCVITIIALLVYVISPLTLIAQSNKPEKEPKPEKAEKPQKPEKPKKQKKKAKLPPVDITGAMLANAQYSFKPSTLNGIVLSNPTSLQFGPDGRLYVSEQGGLIKALTIRKNGPNDYAVTNTEVINLINLIPNHNDDGIINTTITKRQITSILLRGTTANPIIYVTSSDSRIGGPSGDLNLDTNSGIISQLSWDGTKWVKVDLVRGLPRSEENHSNNGMQLDDKTNTLYLAVGGNTNAGSPSTNFAYTTEYALSAAILSINLNAINVMPIKGSGNTAYKYDLPTLDDPTRPNNADGTDPNDPFGGNDGLNQAKIVTGEPVQIYSPGYRNAYDLLITQSRNMYTVDNGANQGWGGYPENEGTANVTNNYISGEPGSTSRSSTQQVVNNLDNFHFIGNVDTYKAGSSYGGHPTPIRANPAGAGLYTRTGTAAGVFRTSTTGVNPLPVDWPPVPVANPIEGSFKMPGVADNSLLTFTTSTNGLVEYTASNFGGALKGSLLACGYSGDIVKISLTSDGKGVTNPKNSARVNQDLPFASNFGSQPLDITVQPDGAVFAGTVWVTVYGTKAITVFEPEGDFTCTGLYNDSDDDGDHFTNADEIDNASQPCSASSIPPDNDKDFISDLNDVDDDNDGIADSTDFFALDPNNGLTTQFTNLRYDLFNEYPGTGLFGLGFTGLMTNKLTDYSELYEDSNLIAGGAVGAFSIVNVSPGDVTAKQNDQENAFQFGVEANGSPFTVQSRILGPFFNNQRPVNNQSQGIYIGNGDQDNYLKIVLNANGGAGGIQVVYENAGVVSTANQYTAIGALSASTVELYLLANPGAGTVQPQYSLNGGQIVNVGPPIAVSGAVLNALKGTTAVGIIATSMGATPFTATWDYIYVTSATNTWNLVTPIAGSIIGREENGYVALGNKAYLMGGRRIAAVQEYDVTNNTWTNKAAPPVELNHFQPVALNGLIYVVGAMNGSFPHEVPLAQVYTYDPASNVWAAGSTIPSNRRRGAGGTVIYNNKIYLVGGITDGHWAGWVPWLDEYDPATNTWRTLANAPRSRDHFHASVINGKLYLAGGRRSSASTNNTFGLTVPEVDVYDFATGNWSTLPASSNMPIPRAGAANVVLGNQLVVIGGESSQSLAHNETHALDVNKNTWTRLADLQEGRHGTGAIVNNNTIYISSGSAHQGGSPLLTTQETYSFSPTTVDQQKVNTITLINSTSDQDIKTIEDGMVIDLSTLPTRNFNIRANTSPATVGSVVFNLTGVQTRKQTETIAPYALFGDNNANYADWTPAPGNYKLITTPYTEANGGGIAGTPLTINFSVVNGNTTGTKVSSFTLVNASTDGDVQTLSNGNTINVATLPSINIRANTTPASVGSVVFELSGSQTQKQTESGAPYSLFKDDNGNYRGWSPVAGTYTLKATPYSGSGGTGTAGTPLTISFTVINQAAAITARKATAAEQKEAQPKTQTANSFPNPSYDGHFTVVLPAKVQGEIFYTLISLHGTHLKSGRLTFKKPTSVMDFDFSKEMILSGEYYLNFRGKDLEAQAKLMKIK